MPSRLARFFCIVVVIATTFLPTGVRVQSSRKLADKFRFEISLSRERGAAPLTGRIVLVLATTKSPEPRFQSGYTALTAAQMFGVNVNDWTPGKPVIVDTSVLGYPIENLAKVPAGDYYVQAVLNIYDTYHLANGHIVELPPDKGEGQHWNEKPGNLYSVVKQIHFDAASNDVIHIDLTEVMSPIDLPKDT